jgi:hypothetical protein
MPYDSGVAGLHFHGVPETVNGLSPTNVAVG